ncbi:hypothetical protein NDK47_22345 [Brevibacillus ruminantium]|uniref:YbaK/aminoacyl-tRNA synthetase-associated domain-containing protein n=1 Tax=Brevibacillus ruminantium TaxID=2950604 RepID=A0ABY4WCB6_9BACL|nr:YbaK/EbsC family protein [Brevibacillus ruminantium]USG64835.1 hypothetical protein NDK47_22345 [Brevibacillus ruminantium]
MDRVKKVLEELGVAYELIEHDRPVRSAKEGAALFGIEIGQTAPVLIVKADAKPLALILSGKRGRLDFAAVASRCGYQHMSMADAREVREWTGYETGRVPLVGHGLPVILDEELTEYREVYGGSGDLNWTLKLSPQVLLQANQIQGKLPKM